MPEPNSYIPAVAHFFWMGRSLPWIYRFAVMSAVRNGGFSGGVLLHHTDPLDDDTLLWARQQGDFKLVPCVLEDLLTEVHGPALAKLCAELVSPVARSNLFRAAIVLQEGGVYLDLDTITVRPLSKLLQTATAFVGDEYIVFPRAVAHSRNPLVLTAAGLRTGLRDVLRRLPRGYLWFERVASLYHRAVNGALLGGVAGHAWLRAYLDAMLEVPAARRLRPHALGTHLLQETTAAYRSKHDDLQVCDPEVFYPLPPEISEHWFRLRGQVDASALDPIVGPRTLVVHWYASVRTKAVVPVLTPQYVREHAGRQLYSRLVSDALGW